MIDYKNLNRIVTGLRFVTYATVNKDGSPHSSPMFFIINAGLTRIYMGTHPDSLHAKNIQRTGQAFATMFEDLGHGDGLYFKIENFHMAEGEAELNESVQAHNARRSELGKDDLPIEFYKDPNPQRMFVGDIVEISTNDVEKNREGHITIDTRTAIIPEKLLK